MLHCIGDSHASIFKFFNGFYVCSIIGATNIGLSNPNSKTQANRKFKGYIDKKIKFDDDILFMCGEGDCGYVIWQRAEKYNTSFDEQFKLSLDNYFNLIMYAKQKINNNSKIIVCDIPYPTLRTGDKNGEVANIRYDIGLRYPQERRTEMTIKYNNEIHEFCKKNNFIHLDYRKDAIDPKTGLIYDKLRDKDRPYDHHFDNNEFCKILSPKLKEMGLIS